MSPYAACYGSTQSIQQGEEFWTRQADYQAVTLLLFFLVVSALDAYSKLVVGTGSIAAALWLQAIVPFAQLELLVALAQDRGNKSMTRRLLRSSTMQWLGQLSMCIYLIHYPVIYYVLWMIYGTFLPWPDFDCSKYASESTDFQSCSAGLIRFYNAHSLPLWAIPIVT